MQIVELIIRVFATILVLLIMARLNGPRQISQMNFYDYIVGIAAGSLAATVSLDSSVNLWIGLTAIAIYLLSSIFMSWLSRKNMVLRRFLSGKPIVLIAKGEIQWNGLKRARMNMNELLSSLRYGGYFDINEIDYAILESIGKLSVQPKGFARPPKIYDLNLSVPNTSLFANVVIDGKILAGNLKAFDKDEAWLMKEIEGKGIQDMKEIGLATLNDQGVLSIHLKNHNPTKHTSFI